MGRYAGQKRRSTKSETYAFGKDYEVVLKKAKKLHRQDNEFYIDKVLEQFTSVSAAEVNIYNYDVDKLEHWKFVENRWMKIEKKNEKISISRVVNGVTLNFELTDQEIRAIQNELLIEFAADVLGNYAHDIVNYDQEIRDRNKLLKLGLLIEQKSLENNSEEELSAIEEVFETVVYH